MVEEMETINKIKKNYKTRGTKNRDNKSISKTLCAPSVYFYNHTNVRQTIKECINKREQQKYEATWCNKIGGSAKY